MFHCNENIPLEQNRKMFLLKIQGEKEKKQTGSYEPLVDL